MEIRWHLYMVANCVLYCVAKPVSLNEVIAAESQQKQIVHTFVHTTTTPKLEELAAEHFSLNKGLKPFFRHPKKFKETGSIISFGKKISPLKYRKTFQIKSPLRPKRIKHSLRFRQKRKNQSVKREISGNEKLNQKYIPLLKSLGMLFDNLLGADSSESAQLRDKRKRVRYYTDTSEILCPCSSKSKANAEFESEETSDTFSEVSAKTSIATTTTSETLHSTAARYFRGFRQNKNHSVLLPRNPTSGRRNDNGLRERSRATHNGGDQRNIPRDHGDSQYYTGNGGDVSDAEDDEENPDDDSRDGASSVRPRGRVRTNKLALFTRNNTKAEADKTSTTDENESTLERPRGIISKLERKNKQSIRRDETESAEFLSKPDGRVRGFISKDEVDIPESVQRESEESAQSDAGHQRTIDGSSTPTHENQEVSTRHDTVAYNIPTVSPEPSKIDPVVFIIDGYSITRNKNGENKLKEKAIHIM